VGQLAAGSEDQRWTLARIRDLVARRFGVRYTVLGIWYLLRRLGWTCQMGARRAIERDDAAVETIRHGLKRSSISPASSRDASQGPDCPSTPRT
jgi:transposase